jgi:hypothetical protein
MRLARATTLGPHGRISADRRARPLRFTLMSWRLDSNQRQASLYQAELRHA